jgi:hypothetical protein
MREEHREAEGRSQFEFEVDDRGKPTAYYHCVDEEIRSQLARI